MSAFPRDPEHFFRWVRNHHDPEAQPQDFIPRRVYGDYMHSLLQTAAEYPGNARLERRHEAVAGIARRGDRFMVRLSSGQSIAARAVVLATGRSPGHRLGTARAQRLPTSPTPGPTSSPTGDLLLVGTGLTMVDVAIAADRPGRTLHTVSRHDLVPAAHRLPTTPLVPPPPGITRIGTLEELQRVVDAHVERTVDETGDWRAAVDGLRPVTAQLWQGLGDDDKRRFVDELRPHLGVHRHRMPPEHRAPAGRDRRLRPPRPAHRHRRVRPAARDGRRGHADRRQPDQGRGSSSTAPDRSARWPRTRCSPRWHTPAWSVPARRDWASTPRTTAGCSAYSRHGCRSTPSVPCDAATCGRPRRCPRSGSRPTTWPGPSYAGCTARPSADRRRLRPHPDHRPPGSGRLQRGARTAAPAAGRRRGRARAGHGPRPRVRAGARGAGPARTRVGRCRLLAQVAEAAHAAAADHHLDDREVSFLDAVTVRLRSDEPTGAAALLRHVRLFPRDALAVSVAVPTVAFGGLTSGARRPSWSRAWGGATATTGGTPASWPSCARTRSAGARPSRSPPTPCRSSRRPGTRCTRGPTCSTRPASTRPGWPGSTSGSAPADPRPTTARTSPGTPRCTS